MLAGISVDYVVRLEQARGPQPSEQVLTALCRALRLETDERDHVFHLAGTAPPHSGQIDLHVRPSVLRLIDRFHDLPALVISANPVLAAVLAGAALFSFFHRSGEWFTRSHHAGAGRFAAGVLELLGRSLLGLILLLGAVPWCIGLGWVVWDSFR